MLQVRHVSLVLVMKVSVFFFAEVGPFSWLIDLSSDTHIPVMDHLCDVHWCSSATTSAHGATCVHHATK